MERPDQFRKRDGKVAGVGASLCGSVGSIRSDGIVSRSANRDYAGRASLYFTPASHRQIAPWHEATGKKCTFAYCVHDNSCSGMYYSTPMPYRF